ncbi:MAG: substrate-binding domain-containing protein [Lentisphaeria bacterium]|nr:substrate-binding domain-containing protein [Lentisphaeria bacterium]
MKTRLILLCSALCFACLAAEPPKAAPNLLSLPRQQLLEVCENQNISQNEFFKANHYLEWRPEDFQRVLGVLYLALYEQGIKLDNDPLLVKQFQLTAVNKDMTDKEKKQRSITGNINFLQTIISNSILAPYNTSNKANVYRYDGTDQNSHMELPVFEKSGLPLINLMDFPALDGSTSTAPLRIALASTMFNLSCGWSSEYMIPFDPVTMQPRTSTSQHLPKAWVSNRGRRDDPRRQKWAEILINARDGIILNHQTVHSWITLHDCPQHHFNCLVINAVSPELVKKYNPDVTVIHPDEYESKIIGYDALVVVANVGNPCQNLTLKDINAIYQGKTKTWDGLTDGQLKGKIAPIWRNISSGTGILMAEKIFGKELTRPKDADDRETIFGMMGVIERLRDPALIGFSFYFYERRIAPRPYVKTLPINGIEPSYKTIADGSYPLRAPIVAAIHKDTPPDAPARILYDFLSTPDGQQVVKAAGYVPLQK